MRIVFTGPHCSGKSTLVDALSKLDEFKDYYISTNLTRKLAEKGFKINQEGTAETQVAIMDIHAKNAEHENLLADRCAIDCLCYTIYLDDNDKLGENAVNTLCTLSEYADTISKKYDLIFYVPPEFPLVADEVRSDDQQFQVDIQELFDDLIPIFNRDVLSSEVIPISGTVGERIQQVMNKVNERNS